MAARQASQPLFDMDAVRRQHVAGQKQFQEDGYLAFEGIMLPGVQKAWAAALAEAGRLNDCLVAADWASLDWVRAPPTCSTWLHHCISEPPRFRQPTPDQTFRRRRSRG